MFDVAAWRRIGECKLHRYIGRLLPRRVA